MSLLLLINVIGVPDDSPAALLQQCVYDFFGRFKRFAAVGGSDECWGGSESG